MAAGGCNFPDVPAAQGGRKVFHHEVYLLIGGRWKQVGELPRPLAYGASVTTPEGLICIGGTSDGRTSDDFAALLTLDDRLILTFHPLPPLPIGLDNCAAAWGAGFVYVAGGMHNGEPNRKAFRLRWPLGTAWEELPDMPGPARVQPCAAVQKGTIGSNFYLLGGFDPTTSEAATDGVRFDVANGRWLPTSHTGGPTLVGASALASGAAHILCVGGVNKDIFEAALRQEIPDYMTKEPAWYRFRRSILAYHTITDSWVEIFDSPLLARAGAALVPLESPSGSLSALLVGGEEKPGIRSVDTTRVDIGYRAHFGLLNWAVLILYLLGMVCLGYYFMKRAGKSGDDFFKGGGRIPWWAAGISIFATMLSAITYMSIPAKAYATDWTYYPMQICILLVAFPVIRYYLPFFRRLNVTTAYEYLERRFNPAVRLLASLLFMIFMVARTALVLFLPSLAMTAVTGIDIYLCIALMALITILYCTMGGVEAVVWGDVIQGIILVGGAVLAAAYLILNTGDGGASGFWQIATEHDKFRLFLFGEDHPFDFVNATWWIVILGGLANNLISYTSDQTVIQRYLTTSDEKSAARGILTNGLMSVVVTIAFFTIGTGLYTFFKTHPAELDITMARGDAIFPFFMMSQLPAGLAGLLIAAVFAATMSTIASNINSISTAFTVDFWSKMRKRSASVPSDAGSDVRIARIAGIFAGLVGMAIACLMATLDIQSLLDYFNTILGLLSGAIGGLFLVGIFFPRIGSWAAMSGFLCGTATVLYMNFFTRVNFLLFGFVSMFVCVVVAYTLSLFIPEKRELPGLTWETLNKK